jgi:hypothetical protein
VVDGLTVPHTTLDTRDDRGPRTKGNNVPEPTADAHRLCPTRASGAHSLIAHWIAPHACLERQQRNYHKCPACQYRGLPADALLPQPPKPPPPELPVSAAPVRRARSKAAKVAQR